MKKTIKIAVLTIGGTICATPIMAQSDISTQLSLLQAKANDVNAQLKAQAANLNKRYNEVNPFIEEQMNDKEDSIYLGLLSEKRVYELQIAELKKAEKIKQAKAVSTQASTDSKTTPTIKTKDGVRKAKKLKVTK